ncbi:MAG: acetyl-CoA carboxylase biotin carboxylase subunit [Legionella sp.]|jgi:3-methylcrotonyl-CoA carboxylase alpha subunit
MFTTILIANRGEIACRIIKTARAMGIKTIAIYSTADQDALHVRLADSAYLVGDAPAKDSYLNIPAIIKIAELAGAQAIHPGYGFLSENPKFAQACAQAGIVFIGPTIDALEAMASKQVAKQLLEKTSVPLTPGYHGKEQSEKHLLEQAQKIGFPVLIKAANGGGGKGMRAVLKAADFAEALAGAKREAMASFADDIMIIEKLLINPRHIEMQIMADNFGSVVHLFERDCSIQRRHQKIIEEAPAPNLSAEVREKLAKAACEVARSIDYRGAGTVEFLLDEKEQFYFMEMNTRLQVEHPVTEQITGLDLVAWQLKIAAGEPLPLAQAAIKAQGHAIECRIYAEDPYNNFIPSIGQITFLKQPKDEGLRIDTGISIHSEISRYYDPMIAKLISFGQTREEAVHRMQQALTHYYIAGVTTNIPFLQAICNHPKFMQAQLSTDFLEKEQIPLTKINSELALNLVVAFDYLQIINSTTDPLLQDTFAWPNNKWSWTYLIEGEQVTTQVHPIDKHRFTLGTNQTPINCHLDEENLSVDTHKEHYQTVVYNTPARLALFTEQGNTVTERFSWDKIGVESTKNTGKLTAPMPATVVAILKNIGDKVTAGEGLIVLEAMKMEHTINAPTDGILSEIYYTVGSQVSEGAKLLALGEPGK